MFLAVCSACDKGMNGALFLFFFLAVMQLQKRNYTLQLRERCVDYKSSERLFPFCVCL